MSAEKLCVPIKPLALMLQLLLTVIIVLNDLKIVALPIRLLEMSANVGGRSQDTEGQGTNTRLFISTRMKNTL